MSEKYPLCLGCDREITQANASVSCPICQFNPICEVCLKLHYQDTHSDQEFIRPPKAAYVPNNEDAKRVRIMAACNISYENMAEIIGCSKSDLKAHYRFQQEQGAEEVTFNLASKLYELAMAGNVTALTFWLKTKAGWKESVENAGSGEGVNKLIQGMSSVDKTQRLLHYFQNNGKKKKNES